MHPIFLKGQSIYSKHSNKIQGNKKYGGKIKRKVTPYTTDHSMTEQVHYAEKRDNEKNAEISHQSMKRYKHKRQKCKKTRQVA